MARSITRPTGRRSERKSPIPQPGSRLQVVCPGLLILKLMLLLFSLSVVSDFATPWTAARQASLSFTVSQNLL